VDIVPRIRSSVAELPGLDKGIAHAVHLLRAGGVETYQSCEGSWLWKPGKHAFAEPTVQFHGTAHDGLRALAWARQHGLPVRELRRVWKVQDGELVGPTWELTFSKETR